MPLQGASATLLLTLAARARAASQPGLAGLPAFADPEAQRIAAALPQATQAYAQDLGFVRGVVLRSLLFDRLTAEFLQAHPSGLCITLGAGLCTRRTRLADIGGAARWLHIDLPQAMALREQHMPDAEPGTHLAESLLQPSWMDRAGLPGERPVLVLLEGVCPYLPLQPLQDLLRLLAERFNRPQAPPCKVVLDHVHPLLAGRNTQVGGMQLPVLSGFENAQQLAALHPAIRVDFEAHPYGSFSAGHQMFETGFHAATGARPYAVVRLALEETSHG